MSITQVAKWKGNHDPLKEQVSIANNRSQGWGRTIHPSQQVQSQAHSSGPQVTFHSGNIQPTRGQRLIHAANHNSNWSYGGGSTAKLGAHQLVNSQMSAIAQAAHVNPLSKLNKMVF